MKMMNLRMKGSMLQSILRMNSKKEERKTRRVSNHLQAMQMQIKNPSEILNMNEGGRERKLHLMEFKTDKAIQLQRVT